VLSPAPPLTFRFDIYVCQVLLGEVCHIHLRLPATCIQAYTHAHASTCAHSDARGQCNMVHPVGPCTSGMATPVSLVDGPPWLRPTPTANGLTRIHRLERDLRIRRPCAMGLLLTKSAALCCIILVLDMQCNACPHHDVLINKHLTDDRTLIHVIYI
jgi:hypothetical protein